MIGEFASGDEDTVSSLDESESNNDIYNDMVVPSYLIDKAADLSQRNYASSLPSFEQRLRRDKTHSSTTDIVSATQKVSDKGWGATGERQKEPNAC